MSFETRSTKQDSAPRLALVLGNGGVRSAAAVGIGEALARMDLRPRLVVGCGSGALFGAAVALGLSAETALGLGAALCSSDLIEHQRWRSYLHLVAPRWAGFGASYSLPSERHLAQQLEAAFGHLRLEDMRTPLRLTATDASSGAPVTLRHGSLAQAVETSIALMLGFPNVEFDDRELVDGALSDPLPLAAARDADVLIALGFRDVMPSLRQPASRRAAQADARLVNNLYDARLDVARARGQQLIEIKLDLPQHIGPWNADALPAAYLAGARAAWAALPAIEAAMATAARNRAWREATFRWRLDGLSPNLHAAG